jgi:hypothetical protein
MLLSASNGQFIAQSDVEAFLSSYVNNMVITDDTFSNISLTNFVNWQNTTGSTYTSLIPDWYNYLYDGGGDIPYLHNGLVHVLMDGATSFTTYTFAGTNTHTFTIGLNQDTVMIPWSDGANYYSKMITRSGESDTALIYTSPTYYSGSTYAMKNYYYHTAYDINSGFIYWFFVKNDNTLKVSQIAGENENVTIAGDVTLRTLSSDNTVFYDGTLGTSLPSYFPSSRSIYPDLGQSTVFAYRQDDSEDNVLILTETGPQYQTVPILDNYSTDIATNDYIVFYKYNPHTIYVVTRDAQVYSLVTEINTTGSYSIYNTDKDTLIYYVDSDTDLRSYTVFRRDTNTFTTITEPEQLPGTNSVYSNYPYQSYD